MTPIRRSVQQTMDPSLLADDQVRLRWLREDLTSCLGEVGAILRRASGENTPPHAFCIAIGAAAPSGDSKPATGETLDEIGAPTEWHPPVTITWTGTDGAAFTYDWRTGVFHREHRSG